jgi:sugar O-acyltransferase (sialic acid O-acetyltransferase NeuD family)
MSLNVFGVGGHSKVVINAARLAGITISNLFDDNPMTHNTELCGIKVIGSIPDAIGGNAIIGIGDNKIRRKISSTFTQQKWQTVIHPSAIISTDVLIGEGSVIMAGVIIQPGAVIGKHCIINTGTCIDHDCVIGDFVHIAPNCSLAGGVSVSEGTFIGIGTSIIPNKAIGSWTIVGAGSVIINDQPDNCTTLGVPAKPIKYNHGQK